MSPSAATIQAATPKCPVGPGRSLNPQGMRPVKLCDKRLEYDPDRQFWVCPDHGNVTTVESLVARQQAAA